MNSAEKKYEILKDVRVCCAVNSSSKKCEESLAKAKKVFTNNELKTISESLNIVIK